MDHAVANTPVLEGKTLVAVDCSGSMDGDPIQKAAIFGATLVRANKDADLILYDDKIKEISLSSRMPVVNLAEDIMQQATGGGTDTSLVFSYIVNKRKYYDRVIIISDNESWKGCGNRLHVQEAYKEYKKMSGQDPFVYAIDIAGYGTSDVAGGRVIHLVGWSNRLLDFIGQAERGETLVDYISEYIPMVERKIPFVEDGDETVDN
jgi:60 kDa SS-A/Ro ribonucleoprotein